MKPSLIKSEKKKELSPQQRNFKLFAIGALLLLGGLGLIVASDIYLLPSEKQLARERDRVRKSVVVCV